MMSCRIARGVGFRFDNSAADPSRAMIVNDHFANEVAGKLHRIVRDFGAANAAEFDFRFAHGRNQLPAFRFSGPGQNIPEISGSEEVLNFRMLADVVRDIGAKRNDLQILGAGKVESRASELCSESPPLESRRHFGVDKGDVVAKTPVSEKREEILHARFEALSFHVIYHRDVVEIKFHTGNCKRESFMN
jgi:hypothetical protein